MPPWPRRRRPTRSLRSGGWSSGFIASDSRASPRNGPPSASTCRDSSSVTLAAAPLSQPSATASRSIRRWASRPSRGCQWQLAPAPSTRAAPLSPAPRPCDRRRARARAPARVGAARTQRALPSRARPRSGRERRGRASSTRACDLRPPGRAGRRGRSRCTRRCRRDRLHSRRRRALPQLRARICARLGFLGVALDEGANRGDERRRRDRRSHVHGARRRRRLARGSRDRAGGPAHAFQLRLLRLKPLRRTTQGGSAPSPIRSRSHTRRM